MNDDINKYMTEARKNLESKNYRFFMENIVMAKLLAQNNNNFLVDVLHLYSDGLYKFDQLKDAYEVIAEALPLIEGEKKLYLLHSKGVLLGRLGALSEANRIFEDILRQNIASMVKYKAINNLAWVYIYQYKISKNTDLLQSTIQKCLEAIGQFDMFDNNVLKKRILNNLGTAYWFQEKYELALKAFEEGLEYVHDDPKIYNNIASTYAQMGEIELFNKFICEAEKSASKTNNRFEKGQTFRIQAEAAEKREDYTKAIDFYVCAHDEYIAAQAILESHECYEKVDELMETIRRETQELIRQNLKAKRLNIFGSEHNFTLKNEE